MTFHEFHRIVGANARPVILVEGTRDLPEADAETLAAFSAWLARSYSHAMFRTGNAAGSDSAFARGVARVDPTRLECVLPYGGHRQKALVPESHGIPLNAIPRVEEERAAYHTAQASPEYESLLAKRNIIPQLRAKSLYLLRDTLKVVGSESAALGPATAGIFYVNRADPMKGGTGHTIRVCRKLGVPVAFQDEWMHWPPFLAAAAP
jgi:hypothetical protein